jgi:hypothetical protein
MHHKQPFTPSLLRFGKKSVWLSSNSLSDAIPDLMKSNDEHEIQLFIMLFLNLFPLSPRHSTLAYLHPHVQFPSNDDGARQLFLFLHAQLPSWHSKFPNLLQRMLNMLHRPTLAFFQEQLSIRWSNAMLHSFWSLVESLLLDRNSIVVLPQCRAAL